MSESAFIVVVPEAENRVHSLRKRFDPAASVGVPAHVTILYPFMSPALIDELVLSEVGHALADIPSFTFSLSQVACFPDAMYLVPEPAAEFVRLTTALVERFPNYLPYGGRFKEIVPHLTVAHGSGPEIKALQSEFSETMSASGPIHSACHSLMLIENSSGVWRNRHTFSLANEARVKAFDKSPS